MSNLRPELCDTSIPSGFTHDDALYRVYVAVSTKRRLIHGKLRDRKLGMSCAIGCAFDDGVKSLPNSVIEEVAAYNDSFPRLSAEERWKKVHAWLKWRVGKAKKKP